MHDLRGLWPLGKPCQCLAALTGRSPALSFFFPSPGFSNQQRHCLEQGGRLLHNLLHTSNTRRVSISYFAAPWEATKKIGFFIITIRIRIFQDHQLKKLVVGCTPSYTQQATHGHSSPVARTHEQSRASTQDEANIVTF